MPEHGPRCPDCSNTLRNLGSSNEIEPFWDRISAFFKYPLKGQSLLMVIITTLVFASTRETLSSYLIVMALTSLYTLYSFSVLKHMAKGELVPPGIMSAFEGNVKILLKSVIWMAGLIFIAVSGFFVAQWLGWLTALMILFLFPASAIIYVHESSVVDAINPVRLLDFFLKTKTGYLILFVHLVLILMVITAIENWISSKDLPEYIYMAVTGFFSVYSSIIIYALCGYFLLQYQRELGLFAVIDNHDLAEPEPLHKVKLFLKKGDYDQALIKLDALIKTNASQELEHYRWDLLLQLKRYSELESKADDILRRFLSVKPFNEIKPFVVYLLNTGGIKITELPVRIQLAGVLNKQHLNKWAYLLLKDTHKQYRNDPNLVKALILLADITLEMSQDEFAKKILSFAFNLASESEKALIKTKRLAFD
jgi:tetratricopeptide (TPR) repeat protein